ncbi:MAG: DUF1922 domain-containing protein [Candidatus Lokiarchaeota archaeon]|nr:DUF1922 domain-containing protein [Candidatus Lokiarchaeota archaeon]
MEETAFKKDKTPYLVFACKKCQQFLYVKTTQKTKKCLRCGRSHQVKTVLNKGEIVRGMTLAVNTVKRKQNELAVPEFRSQNDFIIDTKSVQNNSLTFSYSKEDKIDEPDNRFKFKTLLLKLSKLYSKFPAYLIEIMAEDSGIPSQEIPRLIKKFKKKGFLIPLKDEEFYYKISQKN